MKIMTDKEYINSINNLLCPNIRQMKFYSAKNNYECLTSVSSRAWQNVYFLYMMFSASCIWYPLLNKHLFKNYV